MHQLDELQCLALVHIPEILAHGRLRAQASLCTGCVPLVILPLVASAMITSSTRRLEDATRVA